MRQARRCNFINCFRLVNCLGLYIACMKVFLVNVRSLFSFKFSSGCFVLFKSFPLRLGVRVQNNSSQVVRYKWRPPQGAFPEIFCSQKNLLMFCSHLLVRYKCRVFPRNFLKSSALVDGWQFCFIHGILNGIVIFRQLGLLQDGVLLNNYFFLPCHPTHVQIHYCI